MKRHIHQPGVRDYFGQDFVELQAEPLKVLDAFFGAYPACIIKGCEITQNADGTYNVGAGLVSLEATNPETEQQSKHVMPFEGTQNVALPIYITSEVTVVTRVYNDGKSKPISHNYNAVASGVEPLGAHIVVNDNPVRFVDAVQDPTHQFITDDDRTKWNALQGAITTAVSTLQTAINDGDNATLNSAQSDAQTKATKALNDAKGYTNTKLAEFVASAPDTLNTLNELAAALGDDPNFSTTVMSEIGKRATITAMNTALANTLQKSNQAGYVAMKDDSVVSLTHFPAILTSKQETINYLFSGLQYTHFNGIGGLGSHGDRPKNPTHDWWHHIILNHGSPSGYYVDIVANFSSNRLGFRRMFNNVLHEYCELYHTGNLLPATTTANGLLSAADKTKLNAIGSKEIYGTISADGELTHCNVSGLRASKANNIYNFRHNIGHRNYMVVATIHSDSVTAHNDNVINVYQDSADIVHFVQTGGNGQANEYAKFNFIIKIF